MRLLLVAVIGCHTAVVPVHHSVSPTSHPTPTSSPAAPAERLVTQHLVDVLERDRPFDEEALQVQRVKATPDWLAATIDDAFYGSPLQTTGAIYEQLDQELSQVPSKPIGEWNVYEVEAVGQTYTVRLNGQQTSRLVFAGDPTRPDRALPSTVNEPRYIGLQSHTGAIAFRNITLRAR